MIKFKILVAIITILCFSCGKTKEKQSKESIEKETTSIPVKSLITTYDYDGLAPFLYKKDKNKIYVVNFWATWCKPCVDELPYFEKLNNDFKDKNVEVLLVSLDFPNQLEEQLIPFIKNNKIKSEVVVLDDPDQNKWITAIDETWSGALPATIIYNQNKRAFYEQSFDEESLFKEVQKFIN